MHLCRRWQTTECAASYDSGDIGTCYLEEIGGSSDNCDDGFLTYAWDAEWTWDLGNYVYTDPLDNDYWMNSSADPIVWNYDPINPFTGTNKSSQCVEGSNTITCPAQIQLPFFNTYNLIVTVIIIVLIYFLINSASKKRKVKKKKVRKKKK